MASKLELGARRELAKYIWCFCWCMVVFSGSYVARIGCVDRFLSRYEWHLPSISLCLESLLCSRYQLSHYEAFLLGVWHDTTGLWKIVCVVGSPVGHTLFCCVKDCLPAAESHGPAVTQLKIKWQSRKQAQNIFSQPCRPRDKRTENEVRVWSVWREAFKRSSWANAARRGGRVFWDRH